MIFEFFLAKHTLDSILIVAEVPLSNGQKSTHIDKFRAVCMHTM